MLTDDTLLVPYEQAATDTVILRYNEAGALLNTITLSGVQNALERIFGDDEDPTYFWVWWQSNTLNHFQKIRVSDGAVITNLSRLKFVQGVSEEGATASPTAYSGADFSCVPIVLRAEGSISTFSGRRGIYVPTRGVGGSEGGGTAARFADLGGSIQSGPASGTAAGRIIHVPPDGPRGNSSMAGGMSGLGFGRAIYVPPNAEGNTPDGRQRTLAVPIGTEGYSHR